MATANPTMNEAVYLRAGRADTSASAMTVQGTAIKAAILVGILLATGAYTWTQFAAGATGVANGLLIVGGRWGLHHRLPDSLLS